MLKLDHDAARSKELGSDRANALFPAPELASAHRLTY